MNESTREAEFESAALPYLNDLYRMALRVTGNQSQAEDLAQETYLQAWKSFDRFEIGTNCRAWLFKILFNVIHHDRRRWFRFNLKSFNRADEELDQVLVYEAPVAPHITDEDVLLALDRTPQPYREVILLADVEEFAYKEIAEMLHIPIGTVMSRLSRGRKLLRTELAEFAASYGIQEAKSMACGSPS